MKSKSNWTLEEDLFLRQLGCKQEKKNWIQISQKINMHFKNKIRTSKQCRERFINHALTFQKSELSKNWDQNKIKNLFAAFNEIGPKWNIITSKINGQSENTVKNKFYSCIRKFVRKLNKIKSKNGGKILKNLKFPSVFRLLHAKESMKQLKQQLKERATVIRGKFFQALTDQNLSEQNMVFLIEMINKFNLDSRNYKQERHKARRIKIGRSMIKHHNLSNSILVKNQKNNDKLLDDKLLEKNYFFQCEKVPVTKFQNPLSTQNKSVPFQFFQELLKAVKYCRYDQQSKIEETEHNKLLDEQGIQKQVQQQKLKEIKQVEFGMQANINQQILAEAQYF